jgi:allantoicase
MAFICFHAAAVCILTNTLTEQAVQVFGLFRDFGDWMDGEPKEQERTRRAGKRFSRLIPSLLLRT